MKVKIIKSEKFKEAEMLDGSPTSVLTGPRMMRRLGVETEPVSRMPATLEHGAEGGDRRSRGDGWDHFWQHGR